jgi:hypothetical protein
MNINWERPSCQQKNRVDGVFNGRSEESGFLTSRRVMFYHSTMIELLSLLTGLGFSLFVYVRSIKKAELAPLKKATYFILSLIGITGTIFLFGVLVADKLRSLRLP